jgi:hypothetical protein
VRLRAAHDAGFFYARCIRVTNHCQIRKESFSIPLDTKPCRLCLIYYICVQSKPSIVKYIKLLMSFFLQIFSN